MHKCSQCNAQIEERDAVFCPTCGSPLSKKSRTALVIVAALTLILVVCGFIFKDQVLRAIMFLKPGTAQAAKMAPEQTDFFLVINPGLDQNKGFNRIKEIYLSIPEVKDALDNLLTDFKKESDLDYEEDVKPWLGREMAFILPDTHYFYKNEDAFLLAVSTINKNKTASCMEKLRAGMEADGFSFTEEEYKGIQVTLEKKEYSPLVYAIHNGFLLLSADKNLIYQAIDNTKIKERKNLAESESYLKVMDNLPKDKTGALYMDINSFYEVMARENGISANDLRQLGAYEGLGLSMGFDDKGVRFDYVVSHVPEKGNENNMQTSTAGVANLKRAVDLTPADAIAYVGNANLKQAAENFINKSKQTAFEEFNKELYDFERETGVNIERDILSWMRGEASVALLPNQGGRLMGENVPVALLAIIGVEDQQEAKLGLRRIVDALSREGLEVESYNNGENDVHYLYDPYSREMILGYGFYKDHLIIGSSENLIREAMDKNNKSLGNSDTYRKATVNLPSERIGCAYVNIQQGIDLAYSEMDQYDRQAFDDEGHPFIKPIQTISLGEAKPEDNFIAGIVSICIE